MLLHRRVGRGWRGVDNQKPAEADIDFSPEAIDKTTIIGLLMPKDQPAAVVE
jgi:hypothetical protein